MIDPHREPGGVSDQETADRAADDALTSEIESFAGHLVAHQTEVSDRMRHVLAAIRVAGVPLDCTTAEALRQVGDAMSSIIHEAIDE